MKNLLTLLFLLLGNYCLSQVTFEKSYGGPESDEGMSMVELPDGYIICGISNGFVPGPVHIYVVRTDLNGDTLWTRIYGSDRMVVANSMTMAGDGNPVICGTWYNQSTDESDIFLLKINTDGDTIWTREEFSPLESFGNSIAAAEDGFVICGYSMLSNSTTRMLLVKTDTEGYPVWVKNYGDPLTATGNSVAVVPGGDIIACGGIDNEIPLWNRNIYVVRTDADGDTISTRQYGATDYEIGWDISNGAESGFIITGFTQGSFTPDGNILAMNIADDGTLSWQKQYGQSGLDIGYSGEATDDGGYIFSGKNSEQGVELSTAALIRTDANGDTLWTSRFGAYPINYGRQALQTFDGGYAMCGGTSSPDFSYYDVFLVKTNDAGQVITGVPGYDREQGARIIPNPSTGLFHIQLPGQAREVGITDFAGRCIAVFKESDVKDMENFMVDLKGKSPGLYIVTIQTVNELIIQKVFLTPESR